MRAYLQRSEVRLSTVHRVATALLSGAGLMVLLPVVGRDAVVDVVRHLLTGRFELTHALLAVSVLAALTVPVVSLLVVLRDLTEFYFHANHVGATFSPRFTLTGLKLPLDELGPAAAADLDVERSRARSVELLVPDNDSSRSRVDERLRVYGLGPRSDRNAGAASRIPTGRDEGAGRGGAADPGNGTATPEDLARAAALLDLVASRPRLLLDEVAKVEHGMARHVLRIQMIVLRYVKALLALLSTALAVFAAAAVVEGKAALGPAEEAWLAGVLLLWAPVVVAAVATPVRWLESLLRSEGAPHTAVGQDRALTSVEDLTVRVAAPGFAAALVVMVLSLGDSSISDSGRVVGAAAGFAGIAGMAWALRPWARGGRWRRVLGVGAVRAPESSAPGLP